MAKFAAPAAAAPPPPMSPSAPQARGAFLGDLSDAAMEADVAETGDRYDLVLVDSSDPVGPAVGLFGPEFYSSVRRITPASVITAPSSENATTPESTRLAISVIASPRSPCVAAAMTSTRTRAVARARR